MNNVTRTLVSFAVCILLAVIACTANISEIAMEALMLASLVSGGVFVYYVNKVSEESKEEYQEASAEINEESLNKAA